MYDIKNQFAESYFKIVDYCKAYLHPNHYNEHEFDVAPPIEYFLPKNRIRLRSNKKPKYQSPLEMGNSPYKEPIRKPRERTETKATTQRVPSPVFSEFSQIIKTSSDETGNLVQNEPEDEHDILEHDSSLSRQPSFIFSPLNLTSGLDNGNLRSSNTEDIELPYTHNIVVEKTHQKLNQQPSSGSLNNGNNVIDSKIDFKGSDSSKEHLQHPEIEGGERSEFEIVSALITNLTTLIGVSKTCSNFSNHIENIFMDLRLNLKNLPWDRISSITLDVMGKSIRQARHTFNDIENLNQFFDNKQRLAAKEDIIEQKYCEFICILTDLEEEIESLLLSINEIPQSNDKLPLSSNLYSML
ncbi:hypothetical protein HYPBUDRAFT_149882 [Hyphopichia burtonii NRRL Y-1933]|uniref:Uncharacterized protein n=1 Tax=Hyphopichia burtonii NRRL Y-1933 TaxID=984485 RepID=A0A1E4RFV2_9ASCO|nr:hypothetical protein HYPBUDRAFT_149882 [Hyphopichia burtonii NRRL Y-1933]ODV66111.1 hypothetical protein HYPBUDRAFT_149882 [Hyphopichia burtonii NRRL Y-1933]